MPYEIRMVNGEHCVFKQGTQEKMGCHPTADMAKKQMAALYANEPMMMKAEGTIGGTPISQLPPSSFAYCEPGDGAVSTRCHFPIRDRNGKADPAHVRNAMARLSGSAFESQARPKVEAAAKELGIGMMKATLLDDDAFRLLAIPFGGPIPSPIFPRGVDVDGETFSERTDIKPAWLSERVVDWHHGGDALMQRTAIGKAVDPQMDEDGWWVTVWLDHGERRLKTIQFLAEQAEKTGRAGIYGSSESIAGMTRKADTGEILVWPYWRQTLSTSPQNTKSILRPLKASVDDLYANGMSPTAAFWADVIAEFKDSYLGLEQMLNGVTPTAAFWADPSADLDALRSDLRRSSLAGDDAAKTGRVLSAVNESALRKAVEELFAVLAKLEKPPA